MYAVHSRSIATVADASQCIKRKIRRLKTLFRTKSFGNGNIMQNHSKLLDQTCIVLVYIEAEIVKSCIFK